MPLKAAKTPNSSWKTKRRSTPSSQLGGLFSLTVLYRVPGQIVLQAEGKGAAKAFEHEAGGHRWQRTPPTEKRGRTHTSTITIAVLSVPSETQVQLDPRDLEMKACRGSGAGGQHRNTTDSAVQLTHKPSGLMVRCESERSQHQNLRLAKDLLRSKLQVLEESEKGNARSAKRKKQVGSGMRGDKVRTIRIQANEVVDHKLGTRMSAKQYLRGDLDRLFRQSS